MVCPVRCAALACLGGTLLPLLSPSPAAAVLVTVGGSDYDVSVVSTSYASNSSLFALPPLGQMPWWGNDARASTFAVEVFDQLGPGWDSAYGPVFAYAFDSSLNQVQGLTQSISDINDQIDVTPAANASISYAIATPISPPAAVPFPLPILGATAAYGWSRRLQARLRKSNPSGVRPPSHPSLGV